MACLDSKYNFLIFRSFIHISGPKSTTTPQAACRLSNIFVFLCNFVAGIVAQLVKTYLCLVYKPFRIVSIA